MATVRYRILGILSVTDNELPVAVTAGRERIVLAMLLLRPGRIVGVGELTEAVWGTEPPATARGQLQTCVSRLRRILPDGAILTDPAGYGIRVEPGDLDSAEFLRLVDQARTAAPEQARTAYRAALDLWTGPACAEIDAPEVRQAAAMLDERRALAVEDWVDLELAAGQARELLGELAALVDRFPLRERLRGQLMLALFRAGRQADALAEFRRARDTLRDELGIDPGPELQELHRDLLAGSVPAAAARPSAPVDVVRCLPRTVRDFTGRSGLVDRLIGEVSTAGPAILTIDGMAGSGKTTLALHVATLIGDRYPDAHLFVDLQGHSEHDPVDPAGALLVLLRQLGLAADVIPAALVDRVGLWRTELARRRALVVFDNAASSAQVEDLLPTAAGSLAVVTSRRRLAGLDGVHPESLPVLDPDEAIALLERIVGDRVRAEPEAAAEVVRRCGGLPLAVRLAGARLAHRPRWRVADLVRRLGDAALPELAVESRTVASAFALSFGQLAEHHQRHYRLLGLFPGTLLDAPAAAALTGLPLDEARDLLDELVDVHLLEEPEAGVFRMHDLLREYSALLAEGLPEPERGAAVLALLDLETYALAATTPPTMESLANFLEKLPDLRPDLRAAITDPAARLELRRPDLGAFLEAAVRSGHPQYAWLIPRAAWYLLFYRGYNQDVVTLNERGLAVAREAGDLDGVAMMANYVASYHYRAADYDRTLEYLQEAIAIRERQGDLRGLAQCLSNVASVQVATGRFAEAVASAQESIRLACMARLPINPLSATTQLGIALRRLGRYEEALRIDRLRLMSAHYPGEAHDFAGCLMQMQRNKRSLGLSTLPSDRRYLEIALRIVLERSLAPLEAEVRAALGVVLALQGDYPAALAEHRRSVGIADRMNQLRLRQETLADYGDTLRASGDPGAARAAYRRLIDLPHADQHPFFVARALAGLGECAAVSDPEEARRLWSRALELFERMGAPERFAVADRLRLAESRERMVR
ncbi:AfsR/SARP family transcriptional regulator [Actinoplanes flavus]|uniref:Tetratricopeptide repeat protein n=1 Tax=Actinoplanes flavus TaxID=2820290 RepID=A0ABS3UP21_9ACTN|nr:BTAD domain-containing putative transcriptional regulator [Actinoplanes flavus]MBO3740530.1 tetratricopeptide repeat protein [Actinoplanes flavus]